MAFCYVDFGEKEDRTGEQNKNNHKTQKKTQTIRANKEEKEKIVKYQQELPCGVGRHLKIRLQTVFNRRRWRKI